MRPKCVVECRLRTYLGEYRSIKFVLNVRQSFERHKISLAEWNTMLYALGISNTIQYNTIQ